MAWCPQDSDLLLTAAKDNRVLCWNPNSSEPGGEVSEVNSLFTNVQWRDCMIYWYLVRLCMNYHLLLSGALMFSGVLVTLT